VSWLGTLLAAAVTAIGDYLSSRKAATVPEPTPPVEPGFAKVDAATDAELERRKAASKVSP
jgi:hypothetical protein